jgi:hypothetical protein
MHRRRAALMPPGIAMPTKIDFRDCVHHGIAGPAPEQILASIRAEYCLPRAAPFTPMQRGAVKQVVLQAEDFPALECALGAAAFRQLLSDFRRGSDDLRELPSFLALHRYGRATAALIDLARLELALSWSERAPAARSIGACCLPPSLLRSHPDLTLAFHPAWHWLDLDTPADHWRNALLGRDAASAPPPPRRTRLRVFPEQGRTIAQRLEPATFAFEQALQSGETLRQASLLARVDPIQFLQPLLMAGAVIDVALHPGQSASHQHQPTEVMP